MSLVVICECGGSYETEPEEAAAQHCPGCGHPFGSWDADRGTSKRTRIHLAMNLSLAAGLGLIVLIIGAGVWPRVREARRERCGTNLKRLGVAFHEYHEAHAHFPAAAITGKDGKPLLSWRVALLPHLGYQALYQQFRLDEPWDSPHNLALLSKMPSVYACPSDPDPSPSSTVYRAIVGPKPDLGSVGTMFELSRGVDLREVTDGTSLTLMLAETSHSVPWTKPDDLPFQRDGPIPTFGSRHPGGFNTLFADGSVKHLKFGTSPTVLRAVLTRDGGEVSSG